MWALSHFKKLCRLIISNLAKVFLGFLLASASWGFAFKGFLNFWMGIFIAAFIILFFALTDGRTLKIIRPERGDFAVGVISGILIFSLFFIISLINKKFFPELYRYVEDVKSLKHLAPVYITLPVAVFVSISEEVFWRGFIQRRLMESFGRLKGYIFMIVLYSLSHALTFNLSLVVAALGAGAFWGFLFIWKRDLTPVIISHITWDVMLFVVGM